MNDCIFCKIARKEIPAHIVYEDESFMAFLDIRPETPGYTVVIPKDHYRWVWDVPDAGAYFEVAKKIAGSQQKAFETDWILASIVGEEMHHAHIKVFPNDQVKADRDDFEGNKKKIVENIK